MNWLIKAFVQKSISFLPYKLEINSWFQKNITKGSILTDSLTRDKLNHFSYYINNINKYGNNNDLQNVFELGTGWFPIIPICFFLQNADKIFTIDLNRHLNKENTIISISKIVEFNKKGLLKGYFDADSLKIKKLEEILANDYSFEEILHKLNIEYLIGDASILNLPDKSIDLIISNNTFEHIYINDLNNIINRFKRLLTDNGKMINFIDMTDHFANFDSKITNFNFLKYSNLSWRLLDNNLQPQNRLRINDFRLILKENGFEIIEENNLYGLISEFEKIKLNDNFTKYNKDDILIVQTYISCSLIKS